jgi:hypothetical protein
MSSPELMSFDLDLLEFLKDRRWEDAASVLRALAAKGNRVSLHSGTVEALAYRISDEGRKKSRGRQGDLLVESVGLGEVVKTKLQGTSPAKNFAAFVQEKEHVPQRVPYGERLGRLNEIAREENVSQSKAEKARADYNQFLELANRDDTAEDTRMLKPENESEESEGGTTSFVIVPAAAPDPDRDE